MSAYAAAKAGLVGLTRALAVEIGSRGRHGQRRPPRLDRHRVIDAAGAGAWGTHAGGSRRDTGRGGRGGGLPRLTRGLVRHRLGAGRRRRQHGPGRQGDERLLGHGRRGRRKGQRVLLLHGFPQDLSCWDAVVDLLVADGLLLRALRPAGVSTPRCAPVDVADYALPMIVSDCRCGASTTSVGPTRSWSGHDWGSVGRVGPRRRGTRSGCAASSRCRCRTRGRTRALSACRPGPAGAKHVHRLVP